MSMRSGITAVDIAQIGLEMRMAQHRLRCHCTGETIGSLDIIEWSKQRAVLSWQCKQLEESFDAAVNAILDDKWDTDTFVFDPEADEIDSVKEAEGD